MLRHIPNAVLAAAVLVTPLAAQRGGGLPTLGPATSPAPGSRSFHWTSGQHFHGNGRTVYLGAPFWGDDFGIFYAEVPPVVVVQGAAGEQNLVEREEPKPAAPLLIELQGDRYVR